MGSHDHRWPVHASTNIAELLKKAAGGSIPGISNAAQIINTIFEE
jgi:hypothetical protein